MFIFSNFLKNVGFQLLVVMLLSIPGSFRKIGLFCPCEEKNQCDRVDKLDNHKPHNKEVIVMSVDYSEPRKTWQSWDWSLISSVISDGDPDPTLMCHTHKKGRRYGFSGQLVPSLLSANGSDNPTLTSWLENITSLARQNFADLFLIDLLPVLSPDMNSSALDLVLNTTEIIKTKLYYVHHSTSLVCLIPWEPPCYKECDPVTRMDSLCDFFMLSADSFLANKGEKCLARATVPFPQLHLGFYEYMINRFPANKFILSIPWHGYAYHCNKFIPARTAKDYDKCLINEKDGACDYGHCRKKIDMNELTTTYDSHFSDEDHHVWHKRYSAPYFIMKNETSNETMQVWYEDFTSLTDKYVFVNRMEMAGVALWSGNDLHYASKSWFKGFDDAMWAWVLHGIYLQKENKHSYDAHLESLPKKMAGIGIGCVFIGGFLGFIFGWGVFRRSARKNRRQPFEKDMDCLEEDLNL